MTLIPNSANRTHFDPLFVDAANWDYQVPKSSYAIDTGIDVGLPFAGPRPTLGCYELATRKCVYG
jgi:hypothetical protein